MKLLIRKKWLLSLLLLASCGREPLVIESEYLLANRYASVYVGTPDPRKDFPSVGQRLYIQWHLEKQIKRYEELILKVTLRYQNYECAQIERRIHCPVGRIYYDLLDAEFWEKGGISAFKGEIWGDGELLTTRCHTLWTEVIRINHEEMEGDYGEPDLEPDDVDYQNPLPQDGNDFYKL